MSTTDVTAALHGLIDELRQAPAVHRAEMAQELYQQLTDVQMIVASERRGAVRELREQGLTLNAIAIALGVSLSRVKQMEEGPRKVKPTPAQQVAKLERQLARAQAEAS